MDFEKQYTNDQLLLLIFWSVYSMNTLLSHEAMGEGVVNGSEVMQLTM